MDKDKKIVIIIKSAYIHLLLDFVLAVAAFSALHALYWSGWGEITAFTTVFVFLSSLCVTLVIYHAMSMLFMWFRGVRFVLYAIVVNVFLFLARVYVQISYSSFEPGQSHALLFAMLLALIMSAASCLASIVVHYMVKRIKADHELTSPEAGDENN